MTTQTEALKLALESMKRIDAWLIQRGYTGLMPQEKEVITSIEAALAQQEQEPVGYVQTVIEALYENGDPISVDAAELLQRISAQPEHEPVGRFAKFTDGIWREVTDGSAGQPLYTTPPQRKPLTRGQIREIEVDVSLNPSFDYITPAEQLCRAIEAAHGIKE